MIHVVENFLSEDVAEKLVNHIEESPADWWREVVTTFGKEPKYYTQRFYDQRMKKPVVSKLGESLRSGFFTYSFTRSTKHADGCNCTECLFKEQFLESDDFKELIKIYAGLKNPVLFQHFLSVYKSGDFLSTHTDHGREVAFILNLSKDWKAEYGGLLNVYTEDGIKTFVPKFNSLILLGLENGKGLNHFVSEVSQHAPYPRIALTGWYNEQDS
jgi:hypothetical protein